MLDSDFWRDLAEKFHKVDLYQVVRADWSFRVKVSEERPAISDWKLHGSRGPRTNFEALARRGGLRINPQRDSLFAWLDALLSHGFNTDADSGLTSVEENSGGMVIARTYTGSITAIGEASADLCTVQENIALEAERIEQNKQSPSMSENPAAEVGNPQKSEALSVPTIGEQIEQLRVNSDITQEKLCELTDLDLRTVQRHLASETTPSNRLIGRYERIFSKLLSRRIVIGKLP